MDYSGLWEKKDGRTICRAFAAWEKLSDSEVAGVVAGYAGGGAFIQENFYCEFNGDTPSKLIIDFTDHISGTESSFDDLDDNAIEAAETALDMLLALHDQDAWEDAEQLLLVDSESDELSHEGDDLIKAGIQIPSFLVKLFDHAGLTARP